MAQLLAPQKALCLRALHSWPLTGNNRNVDFFKWDLLFALERVFVMDFILWILSIVLVISGIVRIVKGEVLLGIVFIIVGLLVGPGGTSVFK